MANNHFGVESTNDTADEDAAVEMRARRTVPRWYSTGIAFRTNMGKTTPVAQARSLTITPSHPYTDEHGRTPLVSFQLVSDLHLELVDTHQERLAIIPKPSCDILLLAGDIYVGRRDDFQNVIADISKHYKLVVYVPGNHEFYNGADEHNRRMVAMPMEHIKYHMIDACNRLGNVIMLDVDGGSTDKIVINNDVVLFGDTFWTNIPPESYPAAQYEMTDYIIIGRQDTYDKGRIRLLSPDVVSNLHDSARNRLAATMKEADDLHKQVVVLSHHAPSFAYRGPWTRRGADEQHYKGYYYASDMDEFLTNPPLTAWFHGHTHTHVDKATVHHTKVYSNARGYDRDYNPATSAYKPSIIVDVYADRTSSVRS